MMSWDYWRLLVLISVAGFIGLIIGQMFLVLFLVTFTYVLWLQRRWDLLHRWLLKPRRNEPPEADGVINEITQRIERLRSQSRNRKKKLTNYLQHFRSATAALPDGIVLLDTANRLEWSNHAARQLSGINWPGDKQLNIDNLIRDPHFHQLLANYKAQPDSIQILSPENSMVYLEIKLLDYSKTEKLLLARDITKTMKLQRMRRDFVANVSHELRTPLTVLRGYLETFDQQSDPVLWQQALPVMQQQTQRMHLMIKDLLALSYLETGEKPLQHSPTNVCQLLARIILDAQQLEQYQQHNFDLQCNADYWLMADTDELQSAISNLVFNAVKYTDAKTLIEVIWQVNSHGGQITIKDHGEGIAQHHLERISERFYRVDRGRDRQSGGTGLGLSIVKHIMQRHGGRLEINSELGEWAEFSCFFPAAKIINKPDV